MQIQDNPSDSKDLGYEIFIAMISIISVINMVLLWMPGMDQNTIALLSIMNFGMTILFLLDFLYRLCTASSRSHYFIRNWGWADLLACIPQFRVFRIFRIFKAYRLVKKIGIREIVRHLYENRAETALYILIISVFLILELGSFFIILAERSSPEANIHTATDAIWWTYVTITTVGYGDKYPVTLAGKIVGILVLTTGVGVFATFAGYIANKLLSPNVNEKEIVSDIEKEIGTVIKEEILGKLEEMNKTINDIRIRQSETAVRMKEIEDMMKGRNGDK